MNTIFSEHQRENNNDYGRIIINDSNNSLLPSRALTFGMNTFCYILFEQLCKEETH